ncbi:MAG: hypothetical protein J1F35_05590 [Erysipelotrichales bacterium]|nr:hypothetical protein [Erysipelotrichales bacterium]
MKKYLIIILVLVLTCGCVRVNTISIEDLVDRTINSKYKMYNHVNSGYKYYLPRTLQSVVTDEYNEIIKSKYYDYYLYVDLVAYHTKKTSVYEEDSSIFYSKLITNDDISGVLNVKDVGEEYLIKIIYNYAKIEVRCKKNDLNEVVSNSLVILSSISYIDDVISNLLNKNDFSSAEEQVNIFENDSSDINYLDEIDDTYTGNEEEDYDPNVIKERG